MIRSLLLFGLTPLLAVSLDLFSPVTATAAQAAPTIEIALLLDTSNSMDGLITQAKSQLWTIVQELAEAQREGCPAELRVALFEYGNSNLPALEGYIRQVVPLGTDLDALSEALFALETQGGDEYCGRVIEEAIQRLDWTSAPHAYQAIFIAGNEAFTQGRVPYREACGDAVERGVQVNTIHCGNHEEGVKGEWAAAAKCGHGEALNIDQDRAIPDIPCPQDPVILDLDQQINSTYVWFGSEDDRKYYGQNQREQDRNAVRMSSSVAVKRSITKAGRAYNNKNRDLVDSVEDEADLLSSVPEEHLPDTMKTMSLDERRAYVKEMQKKRAALQAEVRKLSAERELYLAAQMTLEKGEGEEATLGDAVLAAVRKQLKKAGFDTP